MRHSAGGYGTARTSITGYAPTLPHFVNPFVRSPRSHGPLLTEGGEQEQATIS